MKSHKNIYNPQKFKSERTAIYKNGSNASLLLIRSLAFKLSESLQLVPYGFYHIDFSLEQIFSSSYSLNILLNQKLNSAIVLSRIKSTSDGHWLLSVSDFESRNVRHILATTIFDHSPSPSNSNSKNKPKGFDFVHNMVYISNTNSNLISIIKTRLDISVIYNVSSIVNIIERAFKKLTSKLDTLKFHLRQATTSNTRGPLSDQIDTLRKNIISSFLVINSNDIHSNDINEVQWIKWNLNSTAKQIKKFEKEIKKCDGKLDSFLDSLNSSLNFTTKEIKNCDEEFTAIILDIMKDPDNNKFKRQNNKIGSFLSFENFSLAKHDLNSYIQTHFPHLINREDSNPGIFSELVKLDLQRATPFDMTRLIELLESIWNILNTIGIKEGFTPTLDFTCPTAYPIINTLIPRMLKFDYDIPYKNKQTGEISHCFDGLDDQQKAAIIMKRIENPREYFMELKDTKWSSETLMKYYNLIANLASLHLFSIITHSLIIMNQNPKFHLAWAFLKTKAKMLAKVVKSRIDKDIRQKLHSKNGRINKTILTGFDTEYQGQDIAKVKRLSAQISAGAELQILIPKRNPYIPGGINSATGEKYIKHPIPEQGCDKIKAIELINKTINFIWSLMYNEKEKVLSLTADFLSKHPRAKFVENENEKLFIFPILNSDSKRLIKTTFVDLQKLDEQNKTKVKKGGSVASVSVTKVFQNNKGGSVSWQNTDKEEDSVTWKNSHKTWTFDALISEYAVPLFSYDLNTLADDLFLSIRKSLSINLDSHELKSSDVTKAIESCYDITPKLLENKQLDTAKLFHMEEVQPEHLKPLNFIQLHFKHPNRVQLKGINFPIFKNIILLSHFNAAEFSLFDDLEDIKKEFSIIQKSFVTMGLPLKVKPNNWRVTTRDTILLAPAGASLDKVAKMHGLQKGALSIDEIKNMEHLKATNFSKFKEYAMNDAFITLYHGFFILDFIRSTTFLNKIPPTLSTLSKLTLFAHWKKNQYKGYKLDLEELGITPKGLNIYGQPLINHNLFLAALKGGRNEALMFGKDTSENWYDWDAKGCYTTIMAGMGNPDYSKAKVIHKHSLFDPNNPSKLLPESTKLLLNSFSAINVDFEFPSHVKFPSLCSNVDQSVSAYTRKGNANCTGIEFLTALNSGASLTINNGCIIPFEKDSDESDAKLINLPFASFIKTVQDNRLKYPKGSPLELMWKFIGNMVYGQSGQGLSGRKSLDTKTETMVPVKGSVLASPIICSWITGNARALMSETMNNIHKLGYKVLSVTTDGFITNTGQKLDPSLITNLGNNKDKSQLDKDFMENTIIANKDKFRLDTTCLDKFREWRESLGHAPTAYELKTSMKGMISWATRGQLGIEKMEVNAPTIAAATGYQRKAKTHSEFLDVINTSLSSPNKEIPFLQSSLRGANNIFKKGGHVTMTYSDRRFRTIFDNKRQLITPDLLKADLNILFAKLDNLNKNNNNNELQTRKTILEIESKTREINQLNTLIAPHLMVDDKGNTFLDLTNNGGLLLDSRPHENVGICKTNRFVANRFKTLIYNANDFSSRILPPISNLQLLFVRSLMRYFLHNFSTTLTTFNVFDFTRSLANFFLNIGARKRITTKFVSKTMELINACSLQGGFSEKALDMSDFWILWNHAKKAFPEGYLDPNKFFHNPNYHPPRLE